MDSEELIVITGATGFLGVQLVRELLERQPQVRLALLIRDRVEQSGRPGQSAQQRADSIVPPMHRSRVEVYSGDVSLPQCGLDDADYQRLSAEATRVIHCAATVRFDHSLEEARSINVEGTRRVLDFAAASPKLRSLAYVGTAYVAGERTGLIREDELVVGQSYRNTYEQTKAEAEALVQSYLGSLPGVILRPSIIVGDSRTGATSSFKMMYWPLKIYAHKLWRTVPGFPDAVLDIVPVDYVAAAVAQLAFDEAALGSTVHLCAGPNGSATIEQIARRATEYFQVREPRFVDPKLFFAAVRPLLSLALWGRRRRVLRDGRAYRDYFTMRMQFDTANAERLLGPAGIRPPHVLDYLDRLFHYCVESDWGRRQVAVQ
ncbi:MAG TPA: SDR family oxidoreductase [Acidobacteriaceae bacterium]|jgi:long-chain acyl-CoA synthetase|nr:SDR family oxidoreductase [Acidobacteriaceae bacterium]